MAFITFFRITLTFFFWLICLPFKSLSQLPACKDSFPASLLLNNSFEQFSGCNHENDNFEGGYIDGYPSSGGVTVNDWHSFEHGENVFYFNYNCSSGQPSSILNSSFTTDGSRYYVKAPLPLPDSTGFIGIILEPNNIFDTEDKIVKTYITQCLSQPLYSGQPYMLSFFLGFGLQKETNPTDYFASPSPFSIAIFGRQDCPHYPFDNITDAVSGCLTNRTGWVQLGRVQLKGQNEWVQGAIEFTPAADISCIGIGPDCTAFDDNWKNKQPMYFMDKFILAPKKDFSFKTITAVAGNACEGHFVLKAPTYGAGSYQWYKDGVLIANATSQLYTVPDAAAAAGSYAVNISLPYNTCLNTLPFEVSFSDLKNFSLGNDTTACAPAQIQLHAWPDASAYLWQDGSTKAFFNVNKTGNYSVQVTDKYGCIKKDAVQITVQGCDKCELNIPSAFTPNNDGLNDVFRALPQCANIGLRRFKMRIYNRWGQVVFTSNNIYKGWDGTYKTHSPDTGTYIYFIEYAFEPNKPLTKKGTVLLLR